MKAERGFSSSSYPSSTRPLMIFDPLPSIMRGDPDRGRQRSGMLKTRKCSALLFAAGALLCLSLPAGAAGSVALPAGKASSVLTRCPPAQPASVAPLPTSDYLTRPACQTPPPPMRAAWPWSSCRRRTPAPERPRPWIRWASHPLGITRGGPLQAPSPQNGGDGLRPTDLRAAYFRGEAPEAPASAPQTIALVDLQRPLGRSRPGRVRQRIRHRSLHRSGRLLRAGQPTGRTWPPAVPQERSGTGGTADVLRRHQSNQSNT